MNSRRSLGRVLFIVVEVILIAAVPLLSWVGFQTLLDSQSGEFAVDPTEADPGWLAFVDPTPLSAVVEVVDESVSGVTVVIPTGLDTDGGVVVLIPGALLFEGRSIADRSPDQVVTTVERILGLRIGTVMTADRDGWSSLLGDGEVELANPDPVPGPNGGVELPVGRLTVDAGNAPAFLGRSLEGSDQLALEFRRGIFWNALLDSEFLSDRDAGDEGAVDDTDDDGDAALVIASQLKRIAVGAHRVEALSVEIAAGAVIADFEQIELLVNEVVALPRGANPGDRLAVRVLDRAGSHDLEGVARTLGSAGFEVVQIGNATVFDEGRTQLLTTADADANAVAALAALVGADTVVPTNDEEAVSTVTLLVGDDDFISSE